MKKLKLLGVIAIIFSIALVAFLRPVPVTEWWESASDSVKDFFSEQRQIFAPGPLFGPQEGEGLLTRSRVIEWTNIQRELAGLPALSENSKLNESASIKVDDMFEKQYFAHVSPSGDGAGELAGDVEYSFILIGENLALGNFGSDELLVDAWMDSPGHRENILKPGFTEIGVAVKRGEFEGRQTWLAVQHFAKPLSDCPQPQESLKAQIQANQTQLAEWDVELAERREDMENTHPKFGPIYESKRREYNELVERYNALSKATQAIIVQYNEQVNTFNACVKN
ncbi:MAG: hypothetical protein A2919_01680 [Candidatus Spechtbacteria bacterium RIFCSPLOWO2_01_FULL_43_12]|uniref:SCP domain-containing protein n=1 Tax=Candidatus Spechtbacteria bacterium RIFCSPLOWO2_01_FULL_43_12 TaxID=1802162 RepID=A0A1G2HE95_9BACT|nr:MAG: hypothetical protein A2919_01680 [Candidatus Spechtbacteria bacterium RIFCSPLOWO2_01_FULL_43_12]